MRIATWNVNGLRARLDYVLDWLRERRPDVAGIQELKLTDDKFPREALEKAGYLAVVQGQKAWNGVAILTRAEAVAERKGLPGQEEMGARMVEARIGDLVFLTIYCPNGKSVEHPDFEKKLRWLEALETYLKTAHAPERRLVLCGDFNVCPGPLDTWDEEHLRGTIFHTDAERERFAAILGWGLHDVFRAKQPSTRAYSWWDYRAGAFPRNMGLRLDLLLATKSVLDRAASVQIDRDFRKVRGEAKPSDHAPVFVDLRP